MAKKNDSSATVPEALPVQDEVTAKLEALRKDNAEAVQALGNHFGAERWARLVQRAESSGMKAEGIASLAGKMIRTRREWHARNPDAALAGAACGFICAIGGQPTPADVKLYEDAKAAGDIPV